MKDLTLIFFTGLGFITAAGLFFRKLNKRQMQLLGWASALAGLLFIASIPLVYQLDTITTWNTPHSTWQMLLTALVGGGAFAAIFGAARMGGPVVIIGSALLLAGKPDYLSFLTQVEPMLSASQNQLWVFQSVMLIVGLVLSAFIVRKPVHSYTLPVVSAVLLVSGELAGRIAFYNLWTIGM